MEYINFHTHRETAEGVVTPRSFGIHPWHADQETSSDFDTFARKYDADFDAALLVGECGLDKACRSSWQRQLTLFEWQAAVAQQKGKPMVIHCVHAFNDLVALRRRYRQGLWVVHGFTGTPQLAAQLFKMDVWTSWGAALLDERRPKVREHFRDNPYPFLLETDDSPCPIDDIYAVAADLKKTTLPNLADTIKEYYTSLLQHNHTTPQP